ncbi:MAG: hypothetical protein WC437_04785 [Patescibacteria group bacterium]
MIYIQTPFKTNEYGQQDKETLKVFDNGKVMCDCKAQMTHQERDFNSRLCRHIQKFICDFPQLDDYEEAVEN